MDKPTDGENWISIDSAMPEDELEVLAFSPQEGDHYGEADGTYILACREEDHWVDSITGVWIDELPITHWKRLSRPGR